MAPESLSQPQNKMVEEKFLSVTGGDLSTKLTRAMFSQLVEVETEFLEGRLFDMIKKDEKVSYSDFVEFVQIHGDGSKESKIDFLFNVYDINGDGILDREEVAEMLRLNFEENKIILHDSESGYILNELASDLIAQAFKDYYITPSRGIIRTDFHRMFEGENFNLLHNLPILGIHWIKQPDRDQHMPNLGRRKVTKFKKYGKWLSNNTTFFVWYCVYWMANTVLLIAGSILYLKCNTGSLFWHAVGRAIGYCLEFNICVMLLTMMRHMQAELKSTWLARCIPFDDHRYFHVLAGKVMVGLSLGHTVAHLLNLRLEVPTQDAWKFVDYLFVMDASMDFGLVHGFAYLSGFPLLLIFLLIFVFTLNYIKRLKGGYNAFYITHIIGYPAYYVLAIMHAKNIWKWVVVPGIFFVVEQIIRLYKSYFRDNTTIGVVQILPLRVIKLVLKKPSQFTFRPGDYILIKIPHISKFEWHPFTISSPPENIELTLHIRTVGPWTEKIYDFYSKSITQVQQDIKPRDGLMPTLEKSGIELKKSPAINQIITGATSRRLSQTVWTIDNFYDKQGIQPEKITTITKPAIVDPMKVQIDGPYRSPAGNVFVAEHAVLIAGGIGVTPFASILESVMYNRWNNNNNAEHSIPIHKHSNMSKLKKVDFIWLNRGHNSFQWFPDLLDKLLIRQEQFDPHHSQEKFLDIRIYNTKAVRQLDMMSIMLQLTFDLYYQKTNRDFLSQSRSQINRGRPDWEEVFNNLSQTKKGKVTVFFCGPPKLGKKLKAMCLCFGFSFRKEIF